MTRGVVVTPNPTATDVGAEVLADGGNAIDAAIAAALVQGVVDPMMCGIGGFGCLIYFQADTGTAHALDFTARAGSLVREDQWHDLVIGSADDGYGYLLDGNVNEIGYTSIATPGTLAGFGRAHELWGRSSWPYLLEAAIDLAKRGFQVTPVVHEFWTNAGAEGRSEGWHRVTVTPECARIFTVNGQPLGIGQRCVNLDMAATLRTIAVEGWETFYVGDLAHAIADDIADGGGYVTPDDLADYRPQIVDPIVVQYRGRTVHSAPPHSGGLMVARMLGVLERTNFLGWQHNGADHVQVLAEVMKDARALLFRHGFDPEVHRIPYDEILSHERLDASARDIFSSGRLHLDGALGREASTTNQVTVIDAQGNAVSLTHSLGYSSGVVTPGLGFVYNNYMNCFNPIPGQLDSLGPRRRRPTSMAPTIAVLDGNVEVAVGAPGATRISPAIVQVTSNVIDWGMSPVEAVSAPRLDCQGGPIHLEGRISSGVDEELRGRGYKISRHAVNYDRYFARPQLISRTNGNLLGASDPRADGGSAAEVRLRSSATK